MGRGDDIFLVSVCKLTSFSLLHRNVTCLCLQLFNHGRREDNFKLEDNCTFTVINGVSEVYLNSAVLVELNFLNK